MATFLKTTDGDYVNADYVERVNIVEGIAYLSLAPNDAREITMSIRTSDGLYRLERRSYYKVATTDWQKYLEKSQA